MTNQGLKMTTLAAGIFLLGAAGTGPTFAAEQPLNEHEMTSERIEQASLEKAREAIEAAVEEAARAIEADSRLELDIRLIGHTSVSIAGGV
jgi:hypothetical protein